MQKAKVTLGIAVFYFLDILNFDRFFMRTGKTIEKPLLILYKWKGSYAEIMRMNAAFLYWSTTRAGILINGYRVGLGD